MEKQSNRKKQNEVIEMNQITLTGNLGRDPEMSYTPAGKAVTKFSVATSRRYNNAAGEKMEHVDWFNVSAWGTLAETCNSFLVKGNKVLIVGRVELHQWDGQDGPRAAMEVTANSMEFLTPKGSGGDYNADKPVEPADVADAQDGDSSDPPDDLPF